MSSEVDFGPDQRSGDIAMPAASELEAASLVLVQRTEAVEVQVSATRTQRRSLLVTFYVVSLFAAGQAATLVAVLLPGSEVQRSYLPAEAGVLTLTAILLATTVVATLLEGLVRRAG